MRQRKTAILTWLPPLKERNADNIYWGKLNIFINQRTFHDPTYNEQYLQVFIHKTITSNLIHKYDVKLKYFNIKHDFWNTFSASVWYKYFLELQKFC